ESPEIVSMRDGRKEIDSQIDNFAKAIGMGIITETTKSTLLALEAERKQLDDELSRQSIRLKFFSKEEIRYAIGELANYDFATPKQKRALLNTFVKNIEIDEKGNITLQLDLFGYLPSTKFTIDDLKNVRINSPLLRHETIKVLEIGLFLFIKYSSLFSVGKKSTPI
ncbi:MAG: hypothetical protein WCS80_03730, partial [Bacilli bacterium]